MSKPTLTPAEIDALAKAQNEAELKRQQSLDRLAKETRDAVAEAKKK